MKNGDYILVKAPENFPGKKYRDKYCYEHHLVYWQYYGVIPNSNEIIHHIDGDKHNNDVSNLKLMDKHKHVSNHKKIGRTMVELKCPVCGKIFIKEKRKTYLVKPKYKCSCCSRSCSAKLSNMSKEKREKIILDSQSFVKIFKKNIK